MANVLHVAVGAGIPRYFRNSVDSLLGLTNGDVLGFYNYLSQEDFASVKREVAGLDSSRLTLVFRPNLNSGPTKTGSLYRCYNEAVEFAGTRYEYVNFLQADMQLMFWSDEVEEELETIFESSHADNASPVACVSTTFECRGKWTHAYAAENIQFDESLGVPTYRAASMADVGVFKLAVLREQNISFSGHELDMQKKFASMGFVMPKLRTPVCAFIPWPAVVRRGSVRGGSRLKRYPAARLLALNLGYPRPELLENLWMEDWVRPNNWSTWFPYWPSDTLSTKWFRRRREAMGSSPGAFFTTIDGSGVVSRMLKRVFMAAPSPTQLFSDMARALLHRGYELVRGSALYRLRMLKRILRMLKDRSRVRQR